MTSFEVQKAFLNKTRLLSQIDPKLILSKNCVGSPALAQFVFYVLRLQLERALQHLQ